MLVTGARGFLGAPLSRRLLALGAEVHAVSRAARAGAPDGLHWRQAHLEDPSEAQALFRDLQPSIVFHLGGRVTGAPDLDLVGATFQSLLATSVGLLTAAARSGCRRLVLLGSLEEPRGDAAATPTSPYAAAKWAVSAYARLFHHLYRTPAVIVRPFYTYGPGQPEHRVIPHAILSYLRGEAPRLASGRRRLDCVYLDDVIDGLIRSAVYPGLEGTTLELGAGVATPIREVVLRIKKLVGSPLAPEFGVEADRPAGRARVASTKEALAALGWRATTSLDAGLARTVAWYRDQPAAGTAAL